jgi:hypothetical protein
VKDAPERPLIFRPPCQSEIKRTLRHQSRPAKTVLWRGFRKPRNIHSAGMVNAGFPTPSRYGFEMVHTRPRQLCGANRRQWKIYGESNWPDSSQIFA